MVSEKLFDVHAAAEILHVSVSLIHHLTSKRLISFTRLGKRIFFSTADLDAYFLTRRSEVSRIDKTGAIKPAVPAEPARRGRAGAGAA